MSFKSKMKKLISKPGQSVQDLQSTFNQVMFQLGNAQYKKHLIAQENGKISTEIIDLIAQAEKLTEAAAKLPKPAQSASQPLPTAKEGS